VFALDHIGALISEMAQVNPKVRATGKSLIDNAVFRSEELEVVVGKYVLGPHSV
jgi:hypothetical protein